MPANIKGYKAIMKKANELGWPLYYRDDLLVIDKEALSKKDAPPIFGWGIRETGTDLYLPNSIESYQWAEAKRKNAQGDRYFWYDGGGTSLEEVTLEDLIIQLARSLDLAFYQGAYARARQQEITAYVQMHNWDNESIQVWYEAQRETERTRKELEYAERTRKEYVSEEEGVLHS